MSIQNPKTEEHGAVGHPPQAKRVSIETTKLERIFKEYAEENDLQCNPHLPTLKRELEGLTYNLGEYGYLYCPCRMNDLTGDPYRDKKIVCPCAYHKPEIKSDGHCKCELFVAPLGEDPDLISTTIHRVEIEKKLGPEAFEITFVKPGRSRGEVKIWIPDGARNVGLSVESEFDHTITEKDFQDRILFLFLEFEERAILKIQTTRHA